MTRDSRLARTMIAFGITGSLMLAVIPIAKASAASSTVSGAVFRDINADGQRQPSEVGAADVLVEIFDIGTNVVAQTRTSADGSFALPVPTPSGQTLRVEFSTSPGSFLKGGVQLTNGATNVQFVTAGSSNVDWAVQNPSDVCGATSSIQLATPCWKWGDQSSTRKALSAWPYSASDTPTIRLGADHHNLAMTTEAAANEIGTTYGLGYNRATRTLFAGAFYRRFAGLHERRTGAVYAIAEAGTTNAAVAPRPWLDLDELFGAGTAGVDLHPTAPSGSTPWLSNPPTADQLAWFHDTASWPAVTKTSLGDIEVTEDNEHLFIVNLADRRLYRASAIERPRSAADVAVVALPTAPNCAADDSRPFGLGFNDGVGYVGVVCSAESTLKEIGPEAMAAYAAIDLAESTRNVDAIAQAVENFRAVIAPALAQLRGYVFTFDASAMPASAADFRNELEIDLSYQRSNHREMWLPWSDDYTGMILAATRPFEIRWNEPVLSSFAFDGDTMFIGIRNRVGDRASYPSGHPDPTFVRQGTSSTEQHPSFLLEYGTRGALLRACGGASQWQLESDGRCGSDVGNQWVTGGPGGGLFYGHSSELSSGAVVHSPGMLEVVSTQMDPTTEFSNGTAMYLAGSLPTGSGQDTRLSDRSFTAYVSPNSAGATTDTFGKSNGLGDLELLCDGAPIELGDRVWRDDNDNGTQDPDEPGLPGVNVDLINDDGLTIATTTTDMKGSYRFNSSTTPELKRAAAGTLVLRVRTDSPAIPAGYFPKLVQPGTQPRSNSDFVVFYAGRSEARSARLLIDHANPVNHDVDFGFSPSEPVATQLGAITGSVWEDVNFNGERDALDRAMNLDVELLDAAGTVVRRQRAVHRYRFDGLPLGTYAVRFSSLSPTQTWTPCLAIADPARDFDNCVVEATVATTSPITLAMGLATPVDGDNVTADVIVRNVDAGIIESQGPVGTT